MKFLSGVVFYNKPKNITSFGLVKKIQRQIEKMYNQKIKVGHTGTLDKFAEGLMVLLIQEATVFSEYFLKREKTYIAEMQLGKETDTLDPEGKILREWGEDAIRDFVIENKQKILREVKDLVHLKNQIPPKYSAIKISGKRSSDWIRKGVEVSLKPREIAIYKSEVIELLEDGRLCVELSVSSGTYIRAIARDLGLILGIPVMLNHLKRISIGDWSLSNSFISNENQILLQPIQKVLKWDTIQLRESFVRRIQKGNLVKLDLNPIRTENFFILDQNHQIVAWCKKINDSQYMLKKVFTK
ncbi:MAG: tRNA pseudouridine(55) synthase TruB [Leptonema sp. (in: bacteria)]